MTTELTDEELCRWLRVDGATVRHEAAARIEFWKARAEKAEQKLNAAIDELTEMQMTEQEILARSERADGEVARLRAALLEIGALEDGPSACGIGTPLDEAIEIARAALAPVESKGGDDGR